MSFLTENMDTIINADCMDVLKQLPDKCVDLVLTDPPYGMNFKSNHRTKKFNKIENDNNLNWLPQWVNEINRIKKDDSHIFVNLLLWSASVFKDFQMDGLNTAQTAERCPTAPDIKRWATQLR